MAAGSRWRATLAPVAVLLGVACAQANSAEYLVEIVDRDGAPLPGAVVYLESDDPVARPAESGVMDQIDSQFEPHILVVERGAPVTFPNSDSIKHHVFSFSSAKSFEIKLYKDEKAKPLIFDRPGEVELGCNVHDWMLGYIYVVDTPYFTRSDGTGSGRITAPAGRYTLGIWHPRIDAPDSLLTRALGPEQTRLQVQLDTSLLPEYVPSEAVEFDDYD